MIAIAKTDDRLAHGAARNIQADQREDVLRHAHKVKAATSVKQFTAALYDYFADQVLYIDVKKAIGSRAYASAVLMTPSKDGFRIGALVFDARQDRRVRSVQFPCHVDRHAVARVLQRTIGRADMPAVARRLDDHLTVATMTSIELDLGEHAPIDVEIAGKGGVLLGIWDGEVLRLKTWLDVSSISNADRRTRAQSGELSVSFF